MSIKKVLFWRAFTVLACLGLLVSLLSATPIITAQVPPTGNVIFFHPDGFSVSHWGATRFVTVGPDGRLNWDRLPHAAVYLGHTRDSLTGCSRGSATTHAYGVRVGAGSFGRDGTTRIRSLSGFEGSIAHEAMASGIWVGLVNSGATYEGGTAAFVASTGDLLINKADITRQVVESGVRVHLAGGERWYLPLGVRGRFGWGVRTDGRNLIEELRQRGYTVVFTRDELAAVPATTERLWGIFAHGETFHAQPEEILRVKGLPHYVATAPTIAEMSRAALAVLSRAPNRFLLVVEEEGTDNFANVNNATGTLEAGRRADEAIGVFKEYVRANPNTLMLMTSDSDASGMQVFDQRIPGFPVIAEGRPVPPVTTNGAPLDGTTGTLGPAFMSAPDRNGVRHAFAIAWSTLGLDLAGGILVRGMGLNGNQISAAMDNVDIYRLMHRTLFGTHR